MSRVLCLFSFVVIFSESEKIRVSVYFFEVDDTVDNMIPLLHNHYSLAKVKKKESRTKQQRY
jgi:hypothetical protein